MAGYVVRAALAALLALSALAVTPVPAGGSEKAEREKFAARLSALIEKKLHEELSGPDRTVEEVKAVVPDRYKEPEGYDAVEIQIPDQNRRGNSVFVTATFRRGGKDIARINVLAEASVSMKVAVASRDLKRGEVIKADDVELERIRAGAGYSGYVTSLGQAVGRELDVSVRAGNPLLSNRLSSPKLVRTGDVVTIVASSGPMRITALGRAGQDGDEGDWIRVVNIDSNKTINARVTGPGEVGVEF
ncbi:MAG: flagellar basal body P-ring formation chaperone FlgA [Candidatus Nitrospinota bacterium M3_3B_026]